MIPDIPLHKKILSYFTTVHIVDIPQAAHEADLQIYLRKNQFQLVMDNAMYSYGNKYKPFLVGFKQMAAALDVAHRVLILGAGMGSIVQILEEKFRQNNEYTIIELNPTILKLCEHQLQQINIDYAEYIQYDAFEYLRTLPRAPFSLICIDIFDELDVPKACITAEFIDNIYKFLSIGGYAVMNYIGESEIEWQTLHQLFKDRFNHVDIVTHDINKIIIVKK